MAKKRKLIDIVRQSPIETPNLDLLDCEVKSTWPRIPKRRNAESPFLASLTDDDRTALADLYYAQLNNYYMRLFAVVIDKRHLYDYIDAPKLHRKAWELLLEPIERFLAEEHDKHHGIMVADDVGKRQNRSLAAKHHYLQVAGTSVGRRLRHIIELPLFVPSELSNGVQLTDLVAYNVFRCFRAEEVCALLAPLLGVQANGRRHGGRAASFSARKPALQTTTQNSRAKKTGQPYLSCGGCPVSSFWSPAGRAISSRRAAPDTSIVAGSALDSTPIGIKADFSKNPVCCRRLAQTVFRKQLLAILPCIR